MKIRPDMNLPALARHMECAATIKIAEHMRDLLVASGYYDTAHVPVAEFREMRAEAFERAAAPGDDDK